MRLPNGGFQPTEPKPERLDWDFEADVREKKKLANQSRYRKCGAKSKKCSFPSDHLTKKQWKERCGTVVSCNLKKPMLWKEFCGLSTSLQRTYLANLIQQYHTTASDLAKMFGVHPQTVVSRCKMPGINIQFGVGQRMSAVQREAFSEFCNQDDETVVLEKTVEDYTKTTESLPEENNELCSDANREVSRPSDNNSQFLKEVHEQLCQATVSPNMSMEEFSLSFQGIFDVNMVMNSLRSMIPDNTPVKIDIKCVIKKDI